MFIRALNALIGLNCPDQLQGNPHSLISPGTAQESCFHSCLLDEPWTYLPSPAACGWTLWAHPSPCLELCNHCWALATVFESCGVVSWLGSAQPYLGSPSVPTRLPSWRNSTLVASYILKYTKCIFCTKNKEKTHLQFLLCFHEFTVFKIQTFGLFCYVSYLHLIKLYLQWPLGAHANH